MYYTLIPMEYDLSKTKYIEKAEIYKITFQIEGNNFIYIGLDTKCDREYYGTSLIMYHYKRIYGKRIFKKEILESLSNISYVNLCSLEQQYIKQSKKEQKKGKFFSVNYTGENKSNATSWQWMDV